MFDIDDSSLQYDSEATHSRRPLNARQEAFCQFYVRGATAARAARLAGYGEAGAKNQGYRLLQDDRVRDRLDRLREALREERQAAEEAEIAHWVRRGEANIARCLASMEDDDH